MAGDRPLAVGALACFLGLYIAKGDPLGKAGPIVDAIWKQVVRLVQACILVAVVLAVGSLKTATLNDTAQLEAHGFLVADNLADDYESYDLSDILDDLPERSISGDKHESRRVLDELHPGNYASKGVQGALTPDGIEDSSYTPASHASSDSDSSADQTAVSAQQGDSFENGHSSFAAAFPGANGLSEAAVGHSDAGTSISPIATQPESFLNPPQTNLAASVSPTDSNLTPTQATFNKSSPTSNDASPADIHDKDLSVEGLAQDFEDPSPRSSTPPSSTRGIEPALAAGAFAAGAAAFAPTEPSPTAKSPEPEATTVHDFSQDNSNKPDARALLGLDDESFELDSSSDIASLLRDSDAPGTHESSSDDRLNQKGNATHETPPTDAFNADRDKPDDVSDTDSLDPSAKVKFARWVHVYDVSAAPSVDSEYSEASSQDDDALDRHADADSDSDSTVTGDAEDRDDAIGPQIKDVDPTDLSPQDNAQISESVPHPRSASPDIPKSPSSPQPTQEKAPRQFVLQTIQPQGPYFDDDVAKTGDSRHSWIKSWVSGVRDHIPLPSLPVLGQKDSPQPPRSAFPYVPPHIPDSPLLSDDDNNTFKNTLTGSIPPVKVQHDETSPTSPASPQKAPKVELPSTGPSAPSDPVPTIPDSAKKQKPRDISPAPAPPAPAPPAPNGNATHSKLTKKASSSAGDSHSRRRSRSSRVKNLSSTSRSSMSQNSSSKGKTTTNYASPRRNPGVIGYQPPSAHAARNITASDFDLGLPRQQHVTRAPHGSGWQYVPMSSSVNKFPEYRSRRSRRAA